MQQPTGQTPGIWGDIQAGLGAAGGLYGMINSIQNQGTIRNYVGQTNPFAQYRPGYGQQLLGLMQDPSSIAQLPGYQFMLGQGTEAIKRGAAAPGGPGYGSGAEMMELEKYGIGLADQYRMQELNMLSGLAGANISPMDPRAIGGALGGAAHDVGASTMGFLNPTLNLLSKMFPGSGGGGAPGGAPGAPPTDYGGIPPIGDPTQMVWQPPAPPPYLDANWGGIPDTGIQAGQPDWLGWGGGGGQPGGDFVSTDMGGAGGADLTAGLFSFKGAGGQAATPGGFNTGPALQTGSALAGVGLDLAQGRPGAAVPSALGLASKIPGLDPTVAKNLGLGGQVGGDVLGIIQGLKAGGVSGYGQAGVNAAKLGVLGANAGGLVSGAAAKELTGALGYAAVPLALYNFAKTWQSGSTGADALSGASTGAAIGSVIPGVGTLIGAGVGAAVGALSSAFGPGRMDPENAYWNNYAAAYNKNPSAILGATPSQNFQTLAGIFDARGSSLPFYQKFGRMGETRFMDAMMGQINSALRQGTVPANATPDVLFNKVVSPWINQMGGSRGWQEARTSEGAPTKGAISALLTNLIGQWQSGMFSSTSPLGIKGQTVGGLPIYGG